jgi:hypothetical protein
MPPESTAKPNSGTGFISRFLEQHNYHLKKKAPALSRDSNREQSGSIRQEQQSCIAAVGALGRGGRATPRA